MYTYIYIYIYKYRERDVFDNIYDCYRWTYTAGRPSPRRPPGPGCELTISNNCFNTSINT